MNPLNSYIYTVCTVYIFQLGKRQGWIRSSQNTNHGSTKLALIFSRIAQKLAGLHINIIQISCSYHHSSNRAENIFLLHLTVPIRVFINAKIVYFTPKINLGHKSWNAVFWVCKKSFLINLLSYKPNEKQYTFNNFSWNSFIDLKVCVLQAVLVLSHAFVHFNASR